MFLSYISLTKEAVHTTPTIGSNVEEISVKKTRFLVWDIGGQEALRASWSTYFCNTEVCVCVSSQQTCANYSNWLIMGAIAY